MAISKSEPGSVHMIESVEEFQQYIVDAEGAKVLDASAVWCGPCREAEPVLNNYAVDFKNVMFYKFDIDNVPDLATKLSVRAMPTFFFFKGKGEKPSSTQVGMHKPKLKAEITLLAAIPAVASKDSAGPSAENQKPENQENQKPEDQEKKPEVQTST